MPIFGNQTFKLESVDSTNNFAANLIKEKLCRNGAVVMADFQTHGKGQRGNIWSSAVEENLLCSFIWFPDNLAVHDLPRLNWWIGVTLVELMAHYQIQAKVKWPNDIYVGDLKVAGVLIETETKGLKVKSVVIGIGLNVNQAQFSGIRATSMAILLNITFELREVLKTLCISLNRNFNLLAQPEDLRLSYNQKLFKRGEIAQFKRDEQSFMARLIEVSVDGGLILEIDRELVSFGINEITLML